MSEPSDRPARLTATALALSLLTAPVVPLAAQQERFQDTTDVLVVEVPVQVLRDGKPVRGLTAADFEIYDGRKKQEVLGFDVVDLSIVGSAEEARSVPQLPGPARRHFLLLFDLSFAQPSSIVKARSAANDLVLEGLHSADLVAVATYSTSQGARLVLGFTSDKRQIQVALDTLGLAQPAERARDPLGIMIADATSLGASVGPTGGGALSGVDRDAEMLQNLKDMSSISGRVARDVQANQIQALTASLAEMAGWMHSVEGRKYVVYLSEGFDANILLGTGGSSEAERAAIAETNNAAASGEYWRVDSDTRFGNTSAQTAMTNMLEEFVKADCVIQAVDIGGLRASGDVQGSAGQAGAEGNRQEGLFIMANETGGDLYRNFNDLSTAMGQMLEKTSVTYTLAFQPKDLKLDGKFHRIKVELAGGGKGAEIVHRPGYYASRADPSATGMQTRLQSAEAVLAGTSAGRVGAWVLAAPFEVPGERAYVPVLVEIDGEALLRGHKEDVLPAEVYGYAIRKDGAVEDNFSQAMGLDLEKAGAALRQSGFKYWGHFDLDPGEYTVRVLVRNARTGESGLATADLHVPDFAASQRALLPPLFPEPMGKWLIGREQAEDQRDVPFPFMQGDQPFLPAVRPLVPLGGNAAVLLVAHHLGGSPGVESRLFDLGGSPVEGGEITLQSASPGAAGGEAWQAVFTPTRLRAGDYTLVITLTDPASGERLSTSIPIQVVG